MREKEQKQYVAREKDILVSHFSPVERINKDDHQQRIATLRHNMEVCGAQACLVYVGPNLRYFTGIPWSATERFIGMIVTLEECVIVAPKFELGSLEAITHVACEWRLWEEHEDPVSLVAELLNRFNVKDVSVDANLPSGMFMALMKACPHMTLGSAETLIQLQRSCKQSKELALIQRAMDITLEVHKLAFNVLQPGMRASELIRFIDQAHRELGADNGSTFCAVQFGQATAFPHGVPGDPALKENQLVLVDTGCTVGGYHSDITRTYTLDSVSQQIVDIWELEKRAQRAAFDASELSAPCELVDFAARQVLIEHGLGPDYALPGLPHRTGHGIGLEIHEAPYLVKGDCTPLAKGMCFSNEPMIVFPAQFGVRLEDHFYMIDSGAHWFTEPQYSIDKPFG